MEIDFSIAEFIKVEKEGVLFHHLIQGDYLPCYDPKYLTDNELW